MEIKKASERNANDLVSLFDEARATIAKLGINQWQNGYPSREIVDVDISLARSYVVLDNDALCGTFVLIDDTEPTYEKIYEGEWHTGNDNKNYVAIHRVAVSVAMRGKGISTAIINFASDYAKKRGALSLRDRKSVV